VYVIAAALHVCGLVFQPEREPAAKKSNWRQKHEDFVRTIRAARGVQAAMDRGEPLPPPPPPAINPGYSDHFSMLRALHQCNIQLTAAEVTSFIQIVDWSSFQCFVVVNLVTGSLSGLFKPAHMITSFGFRIHGLILRLELTFLGVI